MREKNFNIGLLVLKTMIEVVRNAIPNYQYVNNLNLPNSNCVAERLDSKVHNRSNCFLKIENIGIESGTR